MRALMAGSISNLFNRQYMRHAGAVGGNTTRIPREPPHAWQRVRARRWPTRRRPTGATGVRAPHARARHGVFSSDGTWRARWSAADRSAAGWLAECSRIVARTVRDRPKTPKRDRPRCGAQTRAGSPCAAPVIWDRARDCPRNGRCRLHGGLSPRTVNGGPPDPLAVLKADDAGTMASANPLGCSLLVVASVNAERQALAELRAEGAETAYTHRSVCADPILTASE